MTAYRRAILPSVLLLVAIVGAPLLAVAAANAGQALGPVAQADERGPIPTLPSPDPGARRLSGVLEPLPLVPSDPSAAASRPARNRYLGLSLARPDDAAAMVKAAIEELVVPADAAGDLRDFERRLMLADTSGGPVDPGEGDPSGGDPAGPGVGGPVGGGDPPVGGDQGPPPGDPPPGDQGPPPGDPPPGDPPPDDPAFGRLAKRVMSALGATPGNAVGVNDLAVALLALGLATQGERTATSLDGSDFADHVRLKEAAMILLELATDTFAGDRATVINLAYLRSLNASSSQAPAKSAEALQALLDRSPNDVTARFLLASLEGRRRDRDGLDHALAAAQPFLADPSTAALGHLARGDAFAASAEIRRSESPFRARSLAGSALAEYDDAIRLSGDPGAYAGRAVALDLLGEPAAAAEAQAVAVAVDRGSVAAGIRLAELRGCAGDDQGRLSSADAALVSAGDAADLTLTDVRLWAAPDAEDRAPSVDRGYLGYSLGSARAAWPVAWTGSAPVTGAGGFIVSLDPFDEPTTCLAVDETAPLEQAAEAGLAASLDLRDASSAERTFGQWLKRAPPLPVPDPDPAVEPEPRPVPEGLLAATRLMAGGMATPPADPASAVLAVRSRLQPATAAEICRQLAAAGPAPEVKDALLVCVAEAAVRQDDLATAASTMRGVIRVEDILDETMATRFLEAGTAVEATGDVEAALHLYRVAASVQTTNIAALAKIGDLALSQGDPAAAISHYQLALTALDVAMSQGSEPEGPGAGEERRVQQYLRNNASVARLMLARPEPGGPPDCAANADMCRTAAADLALAVASDPDNWTYLMNAGWVARLSGDDSAARDFLQRALEREPAIPWVIDNDLGVLAAQEGDLAAANGSFRRAVGANPSYDLAQWNLGLLESGRGGLDFLAGQRRLADAVRSNAELRADPLAYRFDDRVYRIEVRRPDRLVVAAAPGNASALSAVAFGTVAAVGAIARLASAFSQPLEEAIAAIALAVHGSGRLRFRGVGRARVAARRIGIGWRAWFIWIPSLIILTATTAISAARTAPDAFGAALLATLFATFLGLVVHAMGHLVVARVVSADVRPARWDPGVVMALVGIPLQLAAGPFLAERVVIADPVRSWWISASGILANVAAAGVAYAVYLVDPLPFLRVLVAVQLAVAAYSLIPSAPLDGDRLARYPAIVAVMALGVAAASLALAVGAA